MKRYCPDKIVDALHALDREATTLELQQKIDEIDPRIGASEDTIRRSLADYCEQYRAKDRPERHLFYQSDKKDGGRKYWGLQIWRDRKTAIDIDEPAPERALSLRNEILRDTVTARRLKKLHGHECRICGTTILLKDSARYSEAHHLRPLGRPHDGPDIEGNIIVVCPNHHAMLDFGAYEIDIQKLKVVSGHKLEMRFIDYHNSIRFAGSLETKSYHLAEPVAGITSENVPEPVDF